MDYCSWRPGATELVDRLLDEDPGATYSMEPFDKSSRSGTSIVFNIRTNDGVRLGTLQCYFPRSESAAMIAFDRWVSVVGSHLTLEIRR